METNSTRRTPEETHWMLDQIEFILNGGCITKDIVSMLKVSHSVALNCENSILTKNVKKQRSKLEVKYY